MHQIKNASDLIRIYEIYIHEKIRILDQTKAGNIQNREIQRLTELLNTIESTIDTSFERIIYTDEHKLIFIHEVKNDDNSIDIWACIFGSHSKQEFWEIHDYRSLATPNRFMIVEHEKTLCFEDASSIEIYSYKTSNGGKILVIPDAYPLDKFLSSNKKHLKY